jgi:catechol 2,3-dioxygenase-like lactoylglutathione lyase family enzyme
MFHHLAIASRDIKKTHEFYTHAMGFKLAKVVALPTEVEGGWSKHLFYDTGDGTLMAFWDLHDPRVPDDFEPSISSGLGLPIWTNHIAFGCDDADGMVAKKQLWLDAGYDVMEIDHDWCISIYTTDPNGILVEWCYFTRQLDEADHAEALELLEATRPELGVPPTPVIHRA